MGVHERLKALEEAGRGAEAEDVIMLSQRLEQLSSDVREIACRMDAFMEVTPGPGAVLVSDETDRTEPLSAVTLEDVAHEISEEEVEGTPAPDSLVRKMFGPREGSS